MNRSTAELNLPVLKPVGSPAKTSAPKSAKSTRVEVARDASTPPAANVEAESDREPAQSTDPSIRVDVPPPRSDPSSAVAPESSFPGQVDEIPIGLIEDDLLGAELCNDMVKSLRRVYHHHKKVVLRSRLKSSILAVKSEGLQQVPVLKQELAEKDAIIAELGRQLAAAQAGGGAGSSSGANQEELAQSQRERDQALQDCTELRQAYADLEEYKKVIEQQLNGADKKLAENMVTIQKLNRDKEWKDREIFDLEEAARVVIDVVQPPHPGVVDSRSILERLKLVPGWLKGAPKRRALKK